MNKSVSSHFYTHIFMATILLFCFNGSLMDSSSSDGSTGPDVDFYGILEDHHRSAPVEKITIGGKYKDIAVYQVPEKVKDQYVALDPKQNKILLDLKEIKKISLKTPASPSQSIIEVSGRKYIIITVLSNNNSKKDFIVETTKRVKCQEADKGPNKNQSATYEDRDLNFSHIKSLTIQGYKESRFNSDNLDVSESPKSKSSASLESQKKGFKENAADILDKIEQNVKNLPQDNPTVFETMKGTILTLLKSLRDQLQKFLDMIK